MKSRGVKKTGPERKSLLGIGPAQAWKCKFSRNRVAAWYRRTNRMAEMCGRRG